MTNEEIVNRFTYHAPIGNQPERYQAIRAGALALAVLINDLAPDSREKSLSLTHLDEVVFWANSSIARNEGY